MIKLEKNLSEIPKSLNSENTTKKQNELIKAGKFIKAEKIYKNYKGLDVKEKLKLIYYNKCAYCEQKVEEIQVEHYRPKTKYWWLVYSWDNLLCACAKCNRNKTNNFEILGNKVNFDNADLTEIHKLRDKYDEIEDPKFFNPEKENPEKHLIFDTKGEMKSNNIRLQFTINKCKLNRDYLIDARKKILDDMKREYKSTMFMFGKQKAISKIINDFKSKNNHQEYIAYRNFCTKIFQKF